MGIPAFVITLATGWVALATVLWPFGSGCAARKQNTERSEPPPPQQVIVVAPVLNLSGTTDLDPLKLTDILASEFVATGTVAVIPVNLTLAALAQRGKAWVETPDDAVQLAREFGADATVVMAVTEFRPYDPPLIGLVMQWYAPSPSEIRTPPAAARDPAGSASVTLSAAVAPGPRFQWQRVFDASQNSILEDVRRFASQRHGQRSPYGWRKYIKSQELYVRYCCWALIKPIERLNDVQRAGAVPTEVEP
jgi:hypothetical protein